MKTKLYAHYVVFSDDLTAEYVNESEDIMLNYNMGREKFVRFTCQNHGIININPNAIAMVSSSEVIDDENTDS